MAHHNFTIIVDDFGRSDLGQLTGIMAAGELVTIGTRRLRIVSVDRNIPMANGFAPHPMAGQSKQHRLMLRVEV